MYKPVGRYLILTPLIEKYEGKIIIPETVRNAATSGVVIAAGPEAQDYKVGDEVVFTQNSEYKFEIDKEPVVVIDSNNVILCKPAKQEDPNQQPLFFVSGKSNHCVFHGWAGQGDCPHCRADNVNRRK